MQISGLRIGYLGPTKNAEQSVNFLGLMQAASIPSGTIATSDSSGAYRLSLPGVPGGALRLVSKALRVGSQLFGTLRPAYVRQVVETIDRERYTHLVAYWGTGPIADIIAIKKQRPHIKIVWNPLCHPQGTTARANVSQNWLAARCLKFCDGVIYSSDAMAAYWRRNVLKGRTMPSLVWPARLSQRYFPDERLAPCADEPNLLFLGRVDWSSSSASMADNISLFLKDLMANGVHVYHARTADSDFGQQFAGLQHPFDYLPLDGITRYATQFDASLVMYNLEAAECADRFDLTVPDRLVTSVAAGIPIALPCSGYTACEEYLSGYPVVQFTSAADLAERLRDRAQVARMRAEAAIAAPLMAGEAYVGVLLDFLARDMEAGMDHADADHPHQAKAQSGLQSS